MNFERKAAEVRRIVEEAMEMYADEVAAGDLEESSDISESFRRGVAHAVCAMILMQEESEIKTGGEAAVRPTADHQNKMTTKTKGGTTCQKKS